jgi:hypothetical protein
MSDGHTEVSSEIRDEEMEEAESAHQADRLPTPEENAAAEQFNRDGVDPNVASHEQEMMQRGASVQGEGQI